MPGVHCNCTCFFTLNIGMRNLAGKCGITDFILNLLIQKGIDNRDASQPVVFLMSMLFFWILPQLTDILFHFLFLFLGVPTLWLFTGKLLIKFSLVFFYRFCKIFISFKNTFLREIKLWVLSLYTDLIGRLGVSYKSEGSKGVCRVSGVITVSRLATKLSGTEDVQFSTWVFLTKLQVSSKSLSSCASFCFIL